MATARASESSSGSDSDSSLVSSDDSAEVEKPRQKPCKYYNDKGCKNSKCTYRHICKYALEGNCRYGSKCLRSHGNLGSSAGTNDPAKAPKLTDGRRFQWQLSDGHSWKDIENDHVLELNYCIPHTKGIRIFNTAYGAVTIDFNKMKDLRKDLRVRRLDNGRSTWIWYCMLKHTWRNYGNKDAKGNSTPSSTSIDERYQRNPRSSFIFSLGGESYEINFKEMKQVSKQRKRAVLRRPVYQAKQ